jgi:hypothetical protein
MFRREHQNRFSLWRARRRVKFFLEETGVNPGDRFHWTVTEGLRFTFVLAAARILLNHPSLASEAEIRGEMWRIASEEKSRIIRSVLKDIIELVPANPALAKARIEETRRTWSRAILSI